MIDEEVVIKQFASYCRKILKCEKIDYYRAYMIKLSMDRGIIDNELYERLVRKLMLAVVKFKIDYEEK